jgi:hypothetical protein
VDDAKPPLLVFVLLVGRAWNLQTFESSSLIIVHEICYQGVLYASLLLEILDHCISGWQPKSACR